MAVVKASIAFVFFFMVASGQPVSCEHVTSQSRCLARIGPLAVAWERGFSIGPLAAISSTSVGVVAAICRIRVGVVAVLAGRVGGSIVLWR